MISAPPSRETERVFTIYQTLFTEAYATARDLNRKLEYDLAHIKKHVNPARSGEMGRSVALLLASIHAPSVWSCAQQHRRHQAERNATAALLAIMAYRAEHNRWPATLAEATPGDLARFRPDPFGAGELVYRVDSGRPLLYSVGMNGEDDGGKRAEKLWAESGDAVFWPPVVEN